MTSDITIENFNNNATEYSFHVVLSSGSLTDRICVAVEYDEFENCYYVEDCTNRSPRVSFASHFDATYRAITLIRKYKTIYN